MSPCCLENFLLVFVYLHSLWPFSGIHSLHSFIFIVSASSNSIFYQLTFFSTSLKQHWNIPKLPNNLPGKRFKLEKKWNGGWDHTRRLAGHCHSVPFGLYLCLSLFSVPVSMIPGRAPCLPTPHRHPTQGGLRAKKEKRNQNTIQWQYCMALSQCFGDTKE